MEFIALVFGLIIGSFLNVCIYRIPREESIAWPGSRCQSCGTHIKWYDNIPLLSFLILRARCRHCRAPIAWRYPLVEALGGLTAFVFARHLLASPGWLIVALAAAFTLIALSFIDIDHMIIPDEMSLGLAGLGLVCFWLNPNFHGALWARFLQAFGGGAAGLLSMWAIAWAGEALFKKEAMGGGDIKLMAGLGALLGWQGVFSTLMMGSFFGAAYGLWLLLAKKAGKADPIPFGPFLSLAGIINLYQLVPLSAFILG